MGYDFYSLISNEENREHLKKLYPIPDENMKNAILYHSMKIDFREKYKIAVSEGLDELADLFKEALDIISGKYDGEYVYDVSRSVIIYDIDNYDFEYFSGVEYRLHNIEDAIEEIRQFGNHIFFYTITVVDNNEKDIMKFMTFDNKDGIIPFVHKDSELYFIDSTYPYTEEDRLKLYAPGMIEPLYGKLKKYTDEYNVHVYAYFIPEGTENDDYYDSINYRWLWLDNVSTIDHDNLHMYLEFDCISRA